MTLDEALDLALKTLDNDVRQNVRQCLSSQVTRSASAILQLMCGG